MSNTLKRVTINENAPATITAAKLALDTLGSYYTPEEISELCVSDSYVEGKIDGHRFTGHDTPEGSIVFVDTGDNSYEVLFPANLYPHGEITEGFPIGPKPILYFKELLSDPTLHDGTNYKKALTRIHDALLTVNDLSPVELVGGDHE